VTSESDLRDRNLGSVFDMFDTDRDGYITEDDLPEAGRRVLDEFQITDDQQRAEFLALYRPICEQLMADCDSDGDGRITMQEFITAFADGLGDPQAYYQRLFGPINDTMAQLIDQDGDGFIDAHEYARLCASQAVDESIGRAAFQLLDTDADGKISTADFSAALGQVFYSQDPADPGTAILGHS